jgi:hypothetical protein
MGGRGDTSSALDWGPLTPISFFTSLRQTTAIVVDRYWFYSYGAGAEFINWPRAACFGRARRLMRRKANSVIN